MILLPFRWNVIVSLLWPKTRSHLSDTAGIDSMHILNRKLDSYNAKYSENTLKTAPKSQTMRNQHETYKNTLN
ncbi:hypothetical protein F4779DRAFT_594795 [Xylariaceae sp. FL0662B]|nr:hypothetical protein F4779DRAFT_594795 [Xylariaceae sp. FL0662B]